MMLRSSREAKAKKVYSATEKKRKNWRWCYTIKTGLTGKSLIGIYMVKDGATGGLLGISFTK
jgi:hypothetical protein